MEILDQDMQMVRDFLATTNAPEYIKGHFENLLSQYDVAADRVEALKDVANDLEHAQTLLKSAEEDVASLEAEIEQRDSDQIGALETVKYWLLDVLVHGRPMQKPPREVLRIVEDVL